MAKALASMPWSARVGAVIVLINLIMVVFGEFIAPYSESQQVAGVWEGMSPVNILGTDNLGRDMFSRMVYGAQTSIGVAFLVTAFSFSFGMILGYMAAAAGGIIDQALSRAVDTLISIPTLILALLVLSVVGPSFWSLVLVTAVLDSTRVFRISRALAMNVVVMDFVEAARLRGEGLWWVMSREVMPNTVGPLVAEFGLRFCFALLFIASLSFLGLGIQPPHSDWGGMVRDNALAINYGVIDPLRALAPLYPAAAIAVLTIGVNLVVDWLLARANRSIDDVS